MSTARSRHSALDQAAVAAAWIISVLSFAPASVPVRAAEPATRPTTQFVNPASAIRNWFAELANSDAAVRSDALTHLMGMKTDDLESFRRIVEESRPLAPAQAGMLRQIVTQVFLSGERYEGNAAAGFLGIRMEAVAVNFHDDVQNAVLGGNGVIVLERMPGFAGARMLRDGDVILSIFERPNTPMRDPADFRLSVQEMGAGAMVHFQILRQGQVIRVGVTLDPRPIQAEQPFGINELLERRRERVETYWQTHFAALVKESVS